MRYSALDYRNVIKVVRGDILRSRHIWVHIWATDEDGDERSA